MHSSDLDIGHRIRYVWHLLLLLLLHNTSSHHWRARSLSCIVAHLWLLVESTDCAAAAAATLTEHSSLLVQVHDLIIFGFLDVPHFPVGLSHIEWLECRQVFDWLLNRRSSSFGGSPMP